MKKNTLSFLSSLAQFEIFPVGNYEQYLPQNSVSQRVGKHWSNVGQYLASSINTYGKVKASSNGTAESPR